MSLPNNITILHAIEAEQDVISIFTYKNTSAWISVKNLLLLAMYDSNIRAESQTKENFLSLEGFKLVLKSIKNYMIYLFSLEPQDIFLGASTGFFIYENNEFDSYFPYYIHQPANMIYMVNCGNLRALLKHQEYIKSNNIVAENYIVGALKKIFIKPIAFFIKKESKEKLNDFCKRLQADNIEVTYKNLFNTYVSFIVGYELYRLFFRFLKIKKAYVVSASTKSDMVAALKSLNIQCIEIQHGIVGNLHIGYNYKFPFDERLPTPDQINVYNLFWKDEIVNAGYFKDSQIKIAGRLKYDIVRDEIKGLDFKYIIFTGQGGFFDKIIAFFQAADPLLTENNIKMFYKPHPRETEKEIMYFQHSISDLQSCSVYSEDLTTEELIKHCFAHVSVFSSCHFDAIYYKGKTYICNVMNANIMEYYNRLYGEKFIKITSIDEVIQSETKKKVD